MPTRMLVNVTAVVVLGLAAAGCGTDVAEDPVGLAEARVAASEEALADAETAAAEAGAAFCESSTDYITALDVYGDVLTDTVTTVGDVTGAGRDLTGPREEATEAADAAATAHEEVLRAQADLAEAQAALAAAQAEAAGQTPPPAAEPTPSAEPPVPSATVARVEQAEAELAAAQESITDSTPLRQAGETFNAAVVSLEVAWLRLFADAGCLSDEQAQQAAAAVRDYTTALQQALTDLGYYDGAIDGVYGPETVAAVEALQEANGLPPTGTVDKATEAALRAGLAELGSAATLEATATTAALQQTLALLGYWDGPVDGEWTDELTQAVQALQTDVGVPPTGVVDAATIAAVHLAVAEALTPTPEPTEPSPEPTPSESAEDA